jgi:hypothetical protein
MIPVPLAWLGVVASAVLVVGLPLRLAGWLHGSITSLMWLPMLAFEVPLGLWLLSRGVADPAFERMSRSTFSGARRNARFVGAGPTGLG